jgi:hypothetical protein
MLQGLKAFNIGTTGLVGRITPCNVAASPILTCVITEERLFLLRPSEFYKLTVFTVESNPWLCV